MSVVSYCRRPACTATADETLRAAAERMEKEGIGFLVVSEDGRPAGVLTDRDVALEVAAEGRDATATRIGEAMTRPPVAGRAGDSLEDALARMASAHVRRLPIVDGEVEGVVSADDLTLLLAREIGGLGEVLVAQLPAGASRVLGEQAPEARARRAAEHYAREVVTASADAPVRRVAKLMQEQAVGSVVLLGPDRKAAGLVTDRDLALRVVAAGRAPAATAVSAVLSAPLVTARPSEPLEEVVARMRTSGVRRIPVLEEGRPVGLVAFDDLLVALGQELAQLAECVGGEIRRARRRSYPARVRHELEDRMEEATTRLRQVGDQTLRTLGRELDQVVDRVAQALRSGSPRARGAGLAVRDLMTTAVGTCTPEDPASEAARVMWERDCGCVPVVAGDGSGRVVGMVTDRDLCMASYTSGARLADLPVRSAMAARVHSCRPDDAVSDAEATMRSAQLRRLPVLDEAGRLQGLLSLADLAEGGVGAAEVGLALEAICRPRRAGAAP